MDFETAMNMIRAGQMLPAKQTINLASENLRKVSDLRAYFFFCLCSGFVGFWF